MACPAQLSCACILDISIAVSLRLYCWRIIRLSGMVVILIVSEIEYVNTDLPMVDD